MGCDVVVALEEDGETLIDVVQRADVSEMVEAPLPERSPESFNLAACFGVVWPCV